MSKLYKASEARAKLGGMSTSSFKRLIDSGKIRKVISPGKTQGEYMREDVDKLAEAIEQFVQVYAEPEQEIDNTEVKANILTIEQRLNRLETKLDEHTALLTQILKRLPDKSS